MSLYPKDYYEGMNFDSFYSWLITSIRCEPKLWIKSSPMYRKICKYLVEQKRKYDLMLENARQQGQECKVPKVYIPPVNLDDEQMEKQNKMRVDLYRDQMTTKR